MRFYLAVCIAVSIVASAQTKTAETPRSDTRQTSRITADAAFAGEEGCKDGVRSVTVPFVMVAEYRGTKNQSKDYAQEGRQYADDDAMIVICFDKNTLVRNRTYSQGSLSLEARLEGTDGASRAVEVSNYTLIGETPRVYRATIQTTAIVDDYRTLARRLRAITPEDSDVEFLTSAGLVHQILEVLTTETKRDATAQFLGIGVTELLDYKQRLATSITATEQTGKKAQELAAQISSAEQDMKRAEDGLAAARIASVNAKNVRDELQKQRDALVRQDPPDQAKIDRAQMELDRAESAHNIQVKQELEQTEGVAQKQVALRLLKEAVALQQDNRKASFQNAKTLTSELKGFLKPDDAILPTIVSLTDLRNGVIDLRSQGGRPGERLVITLRHYNDVVEVAEKKSDYETTPIMDVYIKNFGITTAVADSFLLIKREHEDDADSASPSNFKGAAGVSLLWRNTARPKRVGRRLLRAFDGVSWGINVSYLDFDTSKEIEIGAGLVLGFFHDQLHVGCGRNLNVAKNREYCFLGFSFAKIRENLAGNNDTN